MGVLQKAKKEKTDVLFKIERPKCECASVWNKGKKKKRRKKREEKVENDDVDGLLMMMMMMMMMMKPLCNLFLTHQALYPVDKFRLVLWPVSFPEAGASTKQARFVIVC